MSQSFNLSIFSQEFSRIFQNVLNFMKLHEITFSHVLQYFMLFRCQSFHVISIPILYRHCWLRTAETLARKATRAVKDKFNARIARKNQKLASKGKPIPQYYTTGKSKTGKKTFTGGKDLHKTASYPLRFCSALYRSWVQAQSSTLTDWYVLIVGPCTLWWGSAFPVQSQAVLCILMYIVGTIEMCYQLGKKSSKWQHCICNLPILNLHFLSLWLKNVSWNPWRGVLWRMLQVFSPLMPFSAFQCHWLCLRCYFMLLLNIIDQWIENM